METAMVAAWLVQPLAIVVVLLVVLISAVLLHKSGGNNRPIGYTRLAFGYAGVIIACFIIAGVSSYVSPEEATTKWHVPPERYWTVLRNEFLVLSIVLMYVSLVGVAIIGAPVIFFLARFGFANIPTVLFASVVISMIGAFALVMLSQLSSARFLRDAPIIVGGHLVLALGFCIGIGLPWSIKRVHET
jgi:hypothetical protein